MEHTIEHTGGAAAADAGAVGGASPAQAEAQAEAEADRMAASLLEEEEQAKRNMFGRKGRSKKKSENGPQTSAEKVRRSVRYLLL